MERTRLRHGAPRAVCRCWGTNRRGRTKGTMARDTSALDGSRGSPCRVCTPAWPRPSACPYAVAAERVRGRESRPSSQGTFCPASRAFSSRGCSPRAAGTGLPAAERGPLSRSVHVPDGGARLAPRLGSWEGPTRDVGAAAVALHAVSEVRFTSRRVVHGPRARYLP